MNKDQDTKLFRNDESLSKEEDFEKGQATLSNWQTWGYGRIPVKMRMNKTIGEEWRLKSPEHDGVDKRTFLANNGSVQKAIQHFVKFCAVEIVLPRNNPRARKELLDSNSRRFYYASCILAALPRPQDCGQLDTSLWTEGEVITIASFIQPSEDFEKRGIERARATINNLYAEGKNKGHLKARSLVEISKNPIVLATQSADQLLEWSRHFLLVNSEREALEIMKGLNDNQEKEEGTTFVEVGTRSADLVLRMLQNLRVFLEGNYRSLHVLTRYPERLTSDTARHLARHFPQVSYDRHDTRGGQLQGLLTWGQDKLYNITAWSHFNLTENPLIYDDRAILAMLYFARRHEGRVGEFHILEAQDPVRRRQTLLDTGFDFFTNKVDAGIFADPLTTGNKAKIENQYLMENFHSILQLYGVYKQEAGDNNGDRLYREIYHYRAKTTKSESLKKKYEELMRGRVEPTFDPTFSQQFGPRDAPPIHGGPALGVADRGCPRQRLANNQGLEYVQGIREALESATRPEVSPIHIETTLSTPGESAVATHDQGSGTPRPLTPVFKIITPTLSTKGDGLLKWAASFTKYWDQKGGTGGIASASDPRQAGDIQPGDLFFIPDPGQVNNTLDEHMISQGTATLTLDVLFQKTVGIVYVEDMRKGKFETSCNLLFVALVRMDAKDDEEPIADWPEPATGGPRDLVYHVSLNNTLDIMVANSTGRQVVLDMFPVVDRFTHRDMDQEDTRAFSPRGDLESSALLLQLGKKRQLEDQEERSARPRGIDHGATTRASNTNYPQDSDQRKEVRSGNVEARTLDSGPQGEGTTSTAGPTGPPNAPKGKSDQGETGRRLDQGITRRIPEKGWSELPSQSTTSPSENPPGNRADHTRAETTPGEDGSPTRRAEATAMATPPKRRISELCIKDLKYELGVYSSNGSPPTRCGKIDPDHHRDRVHFQRIKTRYPEGYPLEYAMFQFKTYNGKTNTHLTRWVKEELEKRNLFT